MNRRSTKLPSLSERPAMKERKKRRSKPKPVIPRRASQLGLPGVNLEEARGFKDLSAGIPTKIKCPKCGHTW